MGLEYGVRTYASWDAAGGRDLGAVHSTPQPLRTLIDLVQKFRPSVAFRIAHFAVLRCSVASHSCSVLPGGLTVCRI